MRAKNSSIGTPCTDSITTKCVTWNGPSIPCLEVCTGDSLTDVMYAVATKVCAINTSIGGDISTISLDCLIDGAPPDEINIKVILELLIDNHCSLYDFAHAISTGDAVVTLNLNMRCLTHYDEFLNIVAQDLNTTLQSIVNQVCESVDDITTLNGLVAQLRTDLDAIPPPVTYVEPNVVTCTTGTSKPVSVALPLVAADLCDYKVRVGTADEIDSARTKQPTDLNALLSAVEGWDTSPLTLSDSLGNLWLAYKNLLDRVKVIENTCCGPTCEKIKLGFTVTFNDDGTVDFNFTPGAGTLIPGGFKDCGSTMTLTDKNKKVLGPLAVTIAQDGVVPGVAVSTLATGMISVSINSKFCLFDNTGKNILTCTGCFNLEFNNTMGCCIITNGGTEQTIIYKVTITV